MSIGVNHMPDEYEQSEPPDDSPEVVTIAKPKEVKIESPSAETPLVSPSGKPVPEGYHLTKTGQVRKDRAPRVAGSKLDVVSAIGKEDTAALITNTTEGLHAMLAEVVDPRCALTHEQAKIEGEAIARVMDQYSLDPSGRYLPWIVLIGTILLCETPTFVVVSAKLKTSRSKPKPETMKGELAVITPTEPYIVTGEVP
jgi:hypothetical protein